MMAHAPLFHRTMFSRAGELCALDPAFATLTTIERAVFCAMASFVGGSRRDHEEPSCYAARSTIAERAACSLRSVAAAVERLESLGLIIRLGKQVRTDGGRAHATTRWLLPLCAGDARKGPAYATAADDGTASAGDAHKGSAGDAHKGSAGDAHNIKSSASDPKGASADDDRGSTPTPGAVRPSMLREILDEHPDVNTLDEAEARAWTYVRRSTQDLRTVDSRTRFVRTCLTNDVKGIAAGKVNAARAKRDLRVATEADAAEAARLDQAQREQAHRVEREQQQHAADEHRKTLRAEYTAIGRELITRELPPDKRARLTERRAELHAELNGEARSA